MHDLIANGMHVLDFSSSVLQTTVQRYMLTVFGGLSGDLSSLLKGKYAKNMFVYGCKSSCCPYLLGHYIGHDASKLLIELLIILIFLTYGKC